MFDAQERGRTWALRMGKQQHGAGRKCLKEDTGMGKWNQKRKVPQIESRTTVTFKNV